MILTLNLRPDVTVLAVPVPGDMHSFQLGRNINTQHKIYAQCENGGCRIDLPPGSYELIGLLREATEDVLGELLICQDSVLGPSMVYWSYTSESFTCPTAIISMMSAIYKAGGDPKQNWLLIKKVQ